MRITKLLVVFAVFAAIAAPTALALAFDDYPGYHPPDGIVGTSYDFQFKAHAGCPPYKYSIYRASLPPGLTLSSSGEITGSPTTPGYYPFTVQLEDTCGTQPSQRDFSINVIPKLTITTDNIGFGVTGATYGPLKFAADGGGSQTWSIYSGTLPPGLTFGTDGTLSGTPTTVDVYSWVVRVTDGTRSDTHQVTLEVVSPLAAGAPEVKPSEVGAPISIKLSASGGKAPYAWTQTGGTLPAGVTLAGDTITGTPTAGGSFAGQFTATDAFQEKVVVNVAITVKAKVSIKTLRLPVTKVGKPFQATLRTVGGVGPFTWKVTGGRFPVGIRLDRATGLLHGSARTAGTFQLTFTVRDSLGVTSEQTLTLTVDPAKKKKS